MENKDSNINNCMYYCLPCISLFMACENLLKCICCFPCYIQSQKIKKIIPEFNNDSLV